MWDDGIWKVCGILVDMQMLVVAMVLLLMVALGLMDSLGPLPKYLTALPVVTAGVQDHGPVAHSGRNHDAPGYADL